jgi:DNA-binding response OmpR family regulator
VTKHEFPPKVSGPHPSGRKARFGSFQLLPRQRLLLDAGKRVPIGSRALDILTLLIERAGEVVTCTSPASGGRSAVTKRPVGT